MAVRRKKLTKPDVDQLIIQLTAEPKITDQMLLTFAETVNGGPFKTPKPKPITMKVAKQAVLSEFGCTTVTQLRKNKTFSMSMTGETISLKSKDDWMKLYRRWIRVPDNERNQTGPTCINGIDILENFRPWHVFGLNSETATKEDIQDSYRRLVKIHHPDAGGDERMFLRLKKMRDSLMAFMA